MKKWGGEGEEALFRVFGEGSLSLSSGGSLLLILQKISRHLYRDAIKATRRTCTLMLWRDTEDLECR